MSVPFEVQQMIEASVESGSQLHDPDGDVWARHIGGTRDLAADREAARELALDRISEVDPTTGQRRRCTWEAV